MSCREALGSLAAGLTLTGLDAAAQSTMPSPVRVFRGEHKTKPLLFDPALNVKWEEVEHRFASAQKLQP